MKIGWGSIRRAAIAAVVLLGVVGAVQASPVAADGGGNSAAARACQEGYSSLVGVQDGQVTTFGTPGACVAYAAQGGRLVAASVVQPCLNGGFSDLATSEDSTTAFTSEAACVSYAANGGTLVPFVPFIVDPGFHEFWAHRFSVSACVLDVGVHGLAPSTTYTFVATITNYDREWVDTQSQTRTSRADGDASLTFGPTFGDVQDVTVQTYDATGTVPIGSPSPVFTVPESCSTRTTYPR